jgi:endonuclease-3
VPRESKAARRDRLLAIDDALRAAYPRSTCALDHRTPFQLLVATVLSAQTTDLAVNKATRTLFAKWPTPQKLAQADVDAVGRTIDSIGLWRAKSRNLVALSQQLVDRFAGELPRTVAELTELPGVGRKTATAVLGTAFGIPAGVTVDTHMLRIHALLGTSRQADPAKMAAELEGLLPPERWAGHTHRVIDHGRLVCVARRPRCGVCPVAGLCPSAFSPKAGYKPAHDAKEPASAAGLSWLRLEAAR